MSSKNTKSTRTTAAARAAAAKAAKAAKAASVIDAIMSDTEDALPAANEAHAAPPAPPAPLPLPRSPPPPAVRLEPEVERAYKSIPTVDGRIALLLRVGMTPAEIAEVMSSSDRRVLPAMIYGRINDPQKPQLREAQRAAQDMMHDMALGALRTEGMSKASQALIEVVSNPEAANADRVKAAKVIHDILLADSKRGESQGISQRVSISFDEQRVDIETKTRGEGSG
jgi:type IV secretory pathway VirB10-like protein